MKVKAFQRNFVESVCVFKNKENKAQVGLTGTQGRVSMQGSAYFPSSVRL